MPKKSFYLVLLFIFCLNACVTQSQIQTPEEIIVTATFVPTAFPIRTPNVISIAESPLKESLLEAGDYLIRQQLPNGELSYQVNIIDNNRASISSDIRLMGGTSSLYTVCRISGDSTYCNAADLALQYYLDNLVTKPDSFKGTCYYFNGSCLIDGASTTIDTIYKRWQATNDLMLEDKNLIATAIDIGYFIVSMRKPEGGFYHSFDPHFSGIADINYFVPYFDGEGLVALLQLYEMTENDFWLTQAKEVNNFMVTQPISEDYAHTNAFALIATLDKLSQKDIAYANEIANLIVAGQVRSLNPVNTSSATATKISALSSIAQAFYITEIEHEWLDREIQTFITFVSARQLPNSNCNFEITNEMIEKYGGGIFSSCEDPSIRVDGVTHWINGITAYLEYQSMIGTK